MPATTVAAHAMAEGAWRTIAAMTHGTEKNRCARPRIRLGRNHWEALCRHPEEGELSIGNNLSEWTLRCVAMGRKNWMFAGNDRGRPYRIVPFTLMPSCKLLGIDPYQYLHGLLIDLPTPGDGQAPY